MAIEIRLKSHEPIDKALRRFKNMVEDAGILEEYKERQAFKKPCEKKRAKAMLARARARRELRENQ